MALAEAIINAYWYGNGIYLVRRDQAGKRVVQQQRAEHCFFLGGDAPETALRMLRDSRYCTGIIREGGWWRTKWRYERTDPGAPAQHVRVARYLEEQAGVKTYEADVGPVRRFMTDTECGTVKPRACYLDIETDSRVPFSRHRKEARVLCWVIVGADGARVDAGVLDEETDQAERKLLLSLWRALAPYDQVRGWNLDRFDRPMIEERSKLYRLAFESRQWLWLDHMVLYKRMNAHAAKSGAEKQSMKLDNIGKSLGLGGKTEGVGGSMSWELWSDPKTRGALVDYCYRDTDLMRLIEERTGYIELFQTLVDATDVLPDTHGISPIGQVEGFLFRLGKERCMHFRSMFEFDTYERFDGAFVMQPKWKGIARDVQVADFAGMYPSIITTWNLSPETYRPDVKLRESTAGRPSYLMHIPLKQYPRPDGHCEVPGLHHVFANEPKGILPIAVDTLGELRAKWTKLKASLPPGTPEWNDADRKADAYKIARNSFYGVTGSPMSRFFLREVAESTSQVGVWLAKQTIKFFEEHGAFVGYGDSIAQDRTVVVRRPDGRTSILPVAELFDLGSFRCGRGKEFGLFEGWSALARDEQGHDGWYPLRHVVRHHAPSKLLYRIETKDGQVEVTGDHSLMVANTQMKPDEFIKSGEMFNKVGAQCGRAVEMVDLMDYIGGFRLERVGVGKWSGEIIVNEFEAVGDRIKLTGFHNPKHVQWVRRYFKRGTHEFHALLRVIGAYISEGSASLKGVTTSRFLFSIAQQDRTWLDALANDIAMFTDGVRLTGPLWSEGSNVHYLRSGAATMPCLFSALCGHKSKGKRLPDFTYDLDSNDFGVLWGMLVDGDGSRMQNGVEVYTTSSQQLTAGISYALDQHGIEHAIHHRPSNVSWSIRTRIGLDALNLRRPNRVKLNYSIRDVGDEFVYDLCVDGAHTFVDGIGRVLLHNTDSSMVTGLTEEEFARVVGLCNTELYPRLLSEVGCARNTILLDFEKGFERIVFTNKKRYVGRYSHYKGKRALADSEPEVKGLEWKRGDAARMTRELQGEVIELLMAGNDPPQPDAFVPIVERWQRRVLSAPLVIDDVKVSKTLNKALSAYAIKTKKDGQPASSPPHVRVARELKKRGADVGEGTKIDYFVLDDVKGLVVPAVDWAGECDRHYLWENTIYPATFRLLAAAYPDFDWKRWAVTRPRRVAMLRRRSEIAGVKARKAKEIAAQTDLFGMRHDNNKGKANETTKRISKGPAGGDGAGWSSYDNNNSADNTGSKG